MRDCDGPSPEERDDAGSAADQPLLDLLDALVDERGRVAAAQVLGVNYRTMMACYDTRRVSRRMRQALLEFRDAGGVGGDEPDDFGGDAVPEDDDQSLERRVAKLEEDNRGLRKLVDEQACQLEELGSRVDLLEEREQRPNETQAVDAGDDQGQDQKQDWRPPRHRLGMPDAGVVTLEEQPDEEHAFGPAAPLVAEWRQLRAGGDQVVSRVDRAGATVRRWELEAEMLGEYHLTLPPETHPLDDARRADHVRWRREALSEARRELPNAERLRWARRVLTLGLWWR